MSAIKGDVKMFCPKCGSNLPDEAIFCSKCGYAVKERNDGGKKPVEKNGHRRIILLLVVGIFLAVGIFLIYQWKCVDKFMWMTSYAIRKYIIFMAMW